MLLCWPLVSLVTFIRTNLRKFYHKNQRMSDSFDHIIESSELKGKKKGPKYTHLAMFRKFCVG